MKRAEVKQIVKDTIDELKRGGYLRTESEMIYTDMAVMLSAYYSGGQNDEAITSALRTVETDHYYKVIPLYYSYNYTIQRIAELYGVEISTIVRNKKRLCIEIYKAIQ